MRWQRLKIKRTSRENKLGTVEAESVTDEAWAWHCRGRVTVECGPHHGSHQTFEERPHCGSRSGQLRISAVPSGLPRPLWEGRNDFFKELGYL